MTWLPRLWSSIFVLFYDEPRQMNLTAAILLILALNATKPYMLYLLVGAQSFRNKHARLAKHRIPTSLRWLIESGPTCESERTPTCSRNSYKAKPHAYHSAMLPRVAPNIERGEPPRKPTGVNLGPIWLQISLEVLPTPRPSASFCSSCFLAPAWFQLGLNLVHLSFEVLPTWCQLSLSLAST